MSAPTLKPCPFCGGKAEYDNDEGGYEWVFCTHCGCRTVAKRMGARLVTPVTVEEFWNRRTGEPVNGPCPGVMHGPGGQTTRCRYTRENHPPNCSFLEPGAPQ